VIEARIEGELIRSPPTLLHTPNLQLATSKVKEYNDMKIHRRPRWLDLSVTNWPNFAKAQPATFQINIMGMKQKSR